MDSGPKKMEKVKMGEEETRKIIENHKTSSLLIGNVTFFSAKEMTIREFETKIFNKLCDIFQLSNTSNDPVKKTMRLLVLIYSTAPAVQSGLYEKISDSNPFISSMDQVDLAVLLVSKALSDGGHQNINLDS